MALARALQERATELQTPAERRQQAELDRMLQTAADKVTLVQLTDQAFRCRAAGRTAEHLTHILDVQGVPRFFSPLDRALLRGFQTFGGWLPGVTVPLVKEHMQQETANVVLPAEAELLQPYLAARHREGVRMNLNFLGEAVLGEEEAAQRLEKYLAALQLPEVEVLSVKISTLHSQISPLAREDTLKELCDRLELLYRNAARLGFTRPDGTTVAKFIYLDMEEYRDLQLTAQAFMRTLDRPALKAVSGGIALQAYIPDSAQAQRELQDWARARVAAGGAPITIRIVKGANLELERVEASLRDWPQAPYKTKRETDANYKRMLRESMRPENLAAVRVGVASHNLFDLAYGLVLAAAANAGERVQFEMLEGMANQQRRALLEQTRHLLLYAPACRKEEFLNAIGYLIRRLDENTGPENFLRHAFKLKVGSPDWEQLERGFRESFTIAISDAPRRAQNRGTERFDAPRPEMKWQEFENEPDTDWSLPENSAWAERGVSFGFRVSGFESLQAHSEITPPATRPTPSPPAEGGEGWGEEGLQALEAPLSPALSPLVPRGEREKSGTPWIPLCIAGEVRDAARSSCAAGECRDPSRPGVVLARHAQATEADIEAAVVCARADPGGWRSLGVDARNEILGRAAQEIRRARGELMWAALANGGKTLAESDPEVSEAVDFVEFYRATARYFFELTGVKAVPSGVVVVVPPWNFPIAIPCGGIAAALAAGNTVILKPASDTVLVAWELCHCFWRAGVPRTVLQFAPCPGRGAGRQLVAHPGVDAVILTGGADTALRMLEARPDLRLFAETGGKNATIVTALSDRELAIKHVVQSAFGHSGQKCSATSLLLLEAEVYDDPGFKRMLCDAVKSLRVGSAWELQTRVGPLLRPPSGDLENALKTLEAGESWAVRPAQAGNNPHLWAPGVKYGVRPGSYTHCTEFFGPVLGVMRFERLDEAIAMVNQTGYGLTSGLQSLDEREHAQWKAGVHAGNLYVNRGTTGAVVLRQPFGGTGKSCFGPGLKAGGPNYVAQLLRFEEKPAMVAADKPVANECLDLLRRAILRMSTDEWAGVDSGRLLRAIQSYDEAWGEEFGSAHDHFRLLGQDNWRRYLPFSVIRVRVSAEDAVFDIFARACAARVTGARVVVSTPRGPVPEAVRRLDELTDAWAGAIEFVLETDEELAVHVTELPPHSPERVRFSGPRRVPAVVRAAASAAGVYLADEPVLAEGRLELLWYVKEQSVCHDYHRYGNLGARSSEDRKQPS